MSRGKVVFFTRRRQMKRLLMLFVVLGMAFSTASAVAQKTITATGAPTDWVTMEAMWSAGGPEYRATVSELADKYAAKMDRRCYALVDVQPAIKAYSVYTPPGAEKTRDALVKKQVASLVCLGKYGQFPQLTWRI